MASVKKIGSAEHLLTIAFTDIELLRQTRLILLQEIELKKQKYDILKRKRVRRENAINVYAEFYNHPSKETSKALKDLRIHEGSYFSTTVNSVQYQFSSIISIYECENLTEQSYKRVLNHLDCLLDRHFSSELDEPELLFQKIKNAFILSKDEPICLSEIWKNLGAEWLFQDYLYSVSGPYTHEQIKLLILEDFDRERKYFERLRQKFHSNGEETGEYKRHRIPESVRIEVWRRDGGKCARCGSRENLEYDHIVPVSKGGGNTARNIELLCEKCNRGKGNRIE